MAEKTTAMIAARAMGATIHRPVTAEGRSLALEMAERLGLPEAVIEAQLAHAVKDSLGRAYNRTEFEAQRRDMLQQWANYLDKLRTGAEVIEMPQRAA